MRELTLKISRLGPPIVRCGGIFWVQSRLLGKELRIQCTRTYVHSTDLKVHVVHKVA